MRHLGGVIAPGDGTTFAGRISFDERISAIDRSGGGDDYILPGFVDLQVNGSHGIDVMTAAPEQIAALARDLAREGTTAFLPTAITSPIDRIERVHRAIAQAMTEQAGRAAAGATNFAAILGMHLEGPFISAARLGAHPPLNLEPRGEPLDRILGLEKLRLTTLAPELDGAPDAIARFCARGVIVSIGHTDATLAEADAGIVAGARMFTHLFNGMRPLHHREPGVIGAAMLTSAAIPGVIPDGVHVDPAVLRIVYRIRGARGMLLTSDCVSLGGERDRSTRSVGRAQARVVDGAARLEDGTLAGSIISMLDGVRLMIEKVGVSAGEAAMMAAANPASLLGLDDRGRIEVGARADLLLLSRELKLKAVFIAGREPG